MAEPPFLDIDELLTPVPGDDPAGEPVPYELRQQLEEDRREEDPDAYAPDDPMRPEKPKRAEWSKIVSACSEILARTSKDLLVGARLTEALTKLYGFPGTREGLHLLRRLVEQCWGDDPTQDGLYPKVEDGDLEIRASPFSWLDEADRGARFPTTLRTLPLVSAPEGQFGQLDWKLTQEGRGPLPREDFEKAMLATPPALIMQNAAALDACVAELNALAEALNARMGSVAPGLSGIREALESCRTVVRKLVQMRGLDQAGAPAEAAPADGNGAVTAEAPGGAAPAGALRPAATRAEAYRQLSQAADLLQQLEPHSPIPYLVRKAVELGSLPFPELMRRLIREPNTLAELSRELGIKESEPQQESS
jgi:type VI secretion system protein ImpA